jgi:VWFA-related protein
MPCRVTAASVLAILLGILALHAQQKTESSDAGTISATTELVLVPAQVKEHDGRPLLGLKAEDFVLRSDGKPQLIRVFEPPKQLSAQSTPTPKPTLPNMFSSVPSTGMPEQILILAFDLVNTKFLDQGRARADLIKYLETIPPNQRFALVVITQNGLAQVHNFASDPAVLLEALKKIQGSTSKDVSLPAPPDAFNSTQFATPLTPDVEDRILNTLFRRTRSTALMPRRLPPEPPLRR